MKNFRFKERKEKSNEMWYNYIMPRYRLHVHYADLQFIISLFSCFFFFFSFPFAYLFLVFLFPSGKFVTLNSLYKVINREMVRVFTKPPIGLSANFLFYHFTSALV